MQKNEIETFCPKSREKRVGRTTKNSAIYSRSLQNKLDYNTQLYMKNIFWTGFCNQERTAAISDLEKLVNHYGYITDFKLFSDISIAITIELQELNIDKLYNALKKYISLNDAESVNSVSSAERVIYLNITFMKGTGNLKIDIPAVPG